MIDEILAALDPDVPVTVDCESTGLSPWTGDVIRDVQIGIGDRIWHLPLTRPHSENVERHRLRYLLYQLKGRPLVFANAKFDLSMIAADLDVDLSANPIWDVLTGAWLEDENNPHRDLKGRAHFLFPDIDATQERDDMRRLLDGPTLKCLEDALYAASRLFGARKVTRAQCNDLARQRPEYGRREMWDLTAEEIHPYAVRDIDLTTRLYHYQQSLDHKHPIAVAMPREMAVMRVLMGMEKTGILVDTARAERSHAAAVARLGELENLFEGTNPASNPELQRLVYETWGFPVLARTDAGAPSTARATLELLGDDPRIVGLLEYRRLQKAVTAYYRPLLTHAGPDGRIHPSFKQHGTRTGRFSCVAADTLIEMPRDLTKYPDGVPITDVLPGDWVYAFDWQRELVLKRVKWVGQTGVKRTVQVVFENSAGQRITLRLTPDHLVRLRNGDWRAAALLMQNHSSPQRTPPPRVMTMVRRMVDDGYVKFFPHSIARSYGTLGGGKAREHRWVAEQTLGRKISTKTDVHHIDGNRANNHPTNLQPLTIAEHRGNRHLHQSAMPKIPDYIDGPTDYRAISIEQGPVEPVWDMEVEDVHNFIANGVCVHNCESPNLQTIPREDTDSEVRALFRPAPGYALVGFDLAQAEVRWAAALSRDPALIEVFASGRDIYTEIAAQMGVSRPHAKQTVLANNYGAGAQQLASTLLKGSGRMVTPADVRHAGDLQRLLARTYPVMTAAADRLEQTARRDGRFPLHPPGRYRHFRGPGHAPEEYRKAWNSAMQGGIAELQKDMLIALDAAGVWAEHGAHPLLAIHDEILAEVPTESVPALLAAMQEITDDVNPLPAVRQVLEIKVWRSQSEAPSAVSAASTSPSSVPEPRSSGLPRSTSSVDPSSATTGPESPATATSTPSRAPSFEQPVLPPTSSSEDSPARTSPSPEPGQDSLVNGQVSSSSSPASSKKRSRNGSSSKMSRGCSVLMEDGTWEFSSPRWSTSGTALPGECSMLSTSEWPSDAVVCSLSDVLETQPVPPKYFLSPKAAAGILRRAEKRNRSLPTALEAALRATVDSSPG